MQLFISCNSWFQSG